MASVRGRSFDKIFNLTNDHAGIQFVQLFGKLRMNLSHGHYRIIQKKIRVLADINELVYKLVFSSVTSPNIVLLPVHLYLPEPLKSVRMAKNNHKT